MNPDEAVRAHKDLNAHYSLAIHHSTIQLTDEGLEQPLIDLEAALDAHNISEDVFRAPAHGEPWSIAPLADTDARVLNSARQHF